MTASRTYAFHVACFAPIVATPDHFVIQNHEGSTVPRSITCQSITLHLSSQFFQRIERQSDANTMFGRATTDWPVGNCHLAFIQRDLMNSDDFRTTPWWQQSLYLLYFRRRNVNSHWKIGPVEWNSHWGEHLDWQTTTSQFRYRFVCLSVSVIMIPSSLEYQSGNRAI